jgi:hypothetical protein
MVDAGGHVVATVFAAITGAGTGHGGFAVPNELVRKELAIAATRVDPVSTQSCSE